MKTKRNCNWPYLALGAFLVALFAAVGAARDNLPRLSAFAAKLRSVFTPQMIVILLLKGGALSLLVGLVTRWFQNRKDRFLDGENEYALRKDYVLVVGCDFQVKPLIKRILSAADRLSVLLVTDRDVRGIRLEMATALTRKEAKRLLIMRRDPASDRSYRNLRIRGAASIYLMGDEGIPGRDGILLRASDILAKQAESESETPEDSAIKVYMQLDDPNLYSQMRSRQLPMDGAKERHSVFDLELFNYCDSWVWKCWAEKDSADGPDPYLPLRFKRDAPRVELFVVGSGKALKPVVESAMTLMNYGDGKRNCRLTVVSDSAAAVLPEEEARRALPELEIAACSMRDLRTTAFPALVDAATASDASVTVAIVEDAPDAAVKEYLDLPFAVRNKDVSVLLWMNAPSGSLPDKRLIQGDGDIVRLRYFGMPDRLPWHESRRHEAGADVNYYYSVLEQLPKGTDPAILAAARSLWNEEAARREWTAVPRWKRWSSVNSSDSFKEKAAMVGGRVPTSEVLLRLLKAEHDRWWTERLLADWRPGVRDNARRLHPDLVPFENLDDFTKDVDKICIASMSRQDFIS